MGLSGRHVGNAAVNEQLSRTVFQFQLSLWLNLERRSIKCAENPVRIHRVQQPPFSRHPGYRSSIRVDDGREKFARGDIVRRNSRPASGIGDSVQDFNLVGLQGGGPQPPRAHLIGYVDEVKAAVARGDYRYL